MAKTPPKLPIAPLRDLLAWWKTSKVHGAIFGGLAVSLLSRPRATQDVDAVVLVGEPSLARFLEEGKKKGFRSRIPDPLLFAKEARMIVVTHESSGIDVDLTLGGIPFEVDAIRRARPYKVGRLAVPLVTPEDLIVFKMIANRPIDRIDVIHLVEFFPNLDVPSVRICLREFADLLEMPEIVRDFDQIVAQSSAR